MEAKKSWKKRMEVFARTLKIAFLALLLVVFLRGFVFIPVTVDGISMKNTLQPKDEILMVKFLKVDRFRLVVIQKNEKEYFIKRVIGLPGDTVDYKSNQLYVNGKKVSEPFLNENLKNYHSKTPFTNDFTLEELIGKKKLGKGEYFVLGDNRVSSRDSRLFGVVEEQEILGVAMATYAPLQDARWLL